MFPRLSEHHERDCHISSSRTHALSTLEDTIEIRIGFDNPFFTASPLLRRVRASRLPPAAPPPAAGRHFRRDGHVVQPADPLAGPGMTRPRRAEAEVSTARPRSADSSADGLQVGRHLEQRRSLASYESQASEVPLSYSTHLSRVCLWLKLLFPQPHDFTSCPKANGRILQSSVATPGNCFTVAWTSCAGASHVDHVATFRVQGVWSGVSRQTIDARTMSRLATWHR